MSSLKPCPSCGGEAQTDVGKAGQAAAFCDLFRSYCMDCGTQSPEWSYTEAEAITAWNTRAPIPVTDEMVERVLQALKPFANADMGVTALDPDFPPDGAALRASFDWYDKTQGETLKRHSVRRRDIAFAAETFAALTAALGDTK